MIFPATVPAVSLLLGVVCGCALAPHAPVPWLGALLVVALAASVAGFRAVRLGVVLPATAVALLLAGWLLGIDATRRALDPSLLALFQSGELAAAAAGCDPGVRPAGGSTAVIAAEACTAGRHAPAEGESVGPVVIEGRLREDAVEGAAGYSMSLWVSHVRAGRRIRPAEGGVVLTVYGNLAAGRHAQWRAGRRVRATAQLRLPTVFRNPGVPDSRLALARRGTVLVGSVKSGALVEVTAQGTLAAELAAACRALVRRAVAGSVEPFNRDSAGIVAAILIGDRAGLDDEIRQRLQQAGTYHVIAISGGNIAILAGLSLLLLRQAGLQPPHACLVTAACLVGYAGLVGWGASVSRATVMGVAYLLARACDHRGPTGNVLAVSVALIVAVAPLSIFDPGFSLTVGATLGIIVGAAVLGAHLPRRRWLRAPAALGLASCSAELALLPVAAYVFSRVTIAGLALNFAAIPLMTMAQIAGMALLPAWLLCEPVARAIGYVAHLGAFGLVESARLVDAVSWSTFRLPAPSMAVIACYYAAWFTWLRLRRASRAATPRCRRAGPTARRLAAGCVLATGLWMLRSPMSIVRGGGTGRLSVTFLDVGQADAIVVRFPDGQSLVLDTGGSRGVSTFDVGSRVVAPALWALGIRRLDYLAISHGDPDHAGGAVAVARDFAPRQIWEGVPVPPDPLLRALRREADRAGIPWRTLRAGDTMTIGGVGLRVWHPPPADWERQRVRNDDSLVFELRLGQVSVLLPGDIGRDVERALAGGLPPAVLRVVKVPHHGSSTSSSREFIEALRPRAAILTVGHGTEVTRGVLQTYEGVGAVVFRTDCDGAVTVETEGRSVVVRGWTGRQLRLQAPRS